MCDKCELRDALTEAVYAAVGLHLPKPLDPPVRCKDGTTLSVQASKGHYCTPKSDVGPYESKEVAYLEDKDGKAIEAPEDWGMGSDGVYGWVPCDKIEAFIAAHGGRAEEDA